MNPDARLVEDPVKASFDSQSGEHAQLGAVLVVGGDVHGATFVMQRFVVVLISLMPRLGHSQFHSWPLIHHRNSQRVELLF